VVVVITVSLPRAIITSVMICSQTLRIAGRVAVARRSAIAARNLPVVQRQFSSGHEVDIMDKSLYPKDMHPATYDEAILPYGSWHDNNQMLQVKYNRQLFAGALFFILTAYYFSICPEIDFVRAPKSIGVNPPNFTVHPPKDA
jgi:hypothetical protein